MLDARVQTASGAAAPIDVSAGQDKASILQMFVAGADEYRAYLCSPWRSGDRIYASNGHVLVRLHADGMQAPTLPKGVGPDPRDVDRLFEVTPLSGFVAVADVIADLVCQTCRGSGKRRFRHCDECNGQGEFQRGGHVYACLGCEGAGDIPDDSGYTMRACADCRGYGVDYLRTTTDAVTIGPARFGIRYLGMLARLPGAEIAAVGAAAPAVFRFRDGEGLLAPVQLPVQAVISV